MKERPIIMTAESVRAILEGRKTQTRRVIKPQPPAAATFALTHINSDDPLIRYLWCEGNERDVDEWNVIDGLPEFTCPYGVPGDRLWCREAWWSQEAAAVCYRADYEYQDVQLPPRGQEGLRWRSPIHMPRWASRLTLEITEVRVQRVQEISYEDAKAEGCVFDGPRMMSLYGADNEQRKAIYDTHGRLAFQPLWDSINAKRGYPWESNQWCWAITFKRLA